MKPEKPYGDQTAAERLEPEIDHESAAFKSLAALVMKGKVWIDFKNGIEAIADLREQKEVET